MGLRNAGCTMWLALACGAAVSMGCAPGAVAMAAAARGSSAALPDSVLARVGPDRQVTVADFRSAWRKVAPPARPDSLTPEGARKFLDLLIGKEVLALAALKEQWAWTPDESARYVGMRDQMIMRTVLDSALSATRRARETAGEPPLDDAALGTAARDSTVARMGLSLDQPLLGRLAKAFAALPRPSSDSSFFAQMRILNTMPKVDVADTGRVIATCTDGPFKVSDLLASWQRLNPIVRPRVDDAAQVADLVRNGVFERRLRRDAASREVERFPTIAATLAREREFYAVEHFVEREVYGRLSTDSLTLARFFRGRSHEWDLPLRVRVTRLLLRDRADAQALAPRLSDAAEAESLVTRARRRGVDYQGEYSADSDSALFARAMRAGPGRVLGPDSVAGGWAVARVEEVLPGRPRGFHEVRLLVAQRYTMVESERRMRELLDRLRRRVPVVVNRRAFAILTGP